MIKYQENTDDKETNKGKVPMNNTNNDNKQKNIDDKEAKHTLNATKKAIYKEEKADIIIQLVRQ